MFLKGILMNKIEMINQIKNNSIVCGISSHDVNFVKSLVDNKCKDKDIFVCEGLWAVDKLIENKFEVLNFIYNQELLESDKINNVDLEKVYKMAQYAQKTCSVSNKACEKISDRDGKDDFFIAVRLKKYTLNDLERLISGKTSVLAIVMDGLEQPGNIGAILRSFDAAGGDFAIVTNKQARLSHSRLVRSSLGASFMLPAIEEDIDMVQKWLVKNKFKCVVTDLKAKKSYREIDYSGRIAIIAGNEHTGISNSWRLVQGAESIIIPMLGTVESLNVGFASTLVSYEAGLQKLEKNLK